MQGKQVLMYDRKTQLIVIPEAGGNGRRNGHLIPT
ncbi:Uncharacterised protein [Vibrio cholerae]|nr:Uncharacterised protein [Vibrio cholerae]